MMEADRAKDALAAEQTAHAATRKHAAECEGKAAVLADRVKELEVALATEREARAEAERQKAAADASLAAFREAIGG